MLRVTFEPRHLPVRAWVSLPVREGRIAACSTVQTQACRCIAVARPGLSRNCAAAHVFAFVALVIATIIGCAPMARAQTTGPTVRTTLGTVVGTEGAVRSWKGIPFARPPVGELRWKPPQPAIPWKGARDARRFGNDCMQSPWILSSGQSVSEDCLTLNVWAPRRSGGRRLPVLVFIYGGAYLGGTGGYAFYNGERLAADGAVVVNFHYRVGVFGFLAHPLLTAESPVHASGNYGLLDQIAALKWIRANIAAFGGDPRRVTVFGESAGAVSIACLMASPLAAGLFDGAILQSPVLPTLVTLGEGEAAGTRLGRDLVALRAMNAGELLMYNPDFFAPTPHRIMTASFPAPILDGYSLPVQPRQAFISGPVHAVPTIVGVMADEGRNVVSDEMPVTLASYREWLEVTFGSRAAEFARLYPASDDQTARQALALASGQGAFDESARTIARGVAAHQRRTYSYLFSRSLQGLPPAATHSEDLWYVFGTLDQPGFTRRPAANQDDWALSARIRAAWIRFARTGDPNGAGLPSWPAYDGTDPYLEFGDVIRPGVGRHTQELDAFTRFLADPRAP